MVDLTQFKKTKTVSSGRTKTLLNFTDKNYPEAYRILTKLRTDGLDIKALIPALLREALKDEDLEQDEKTAEPSAEEVKE